MTDTIKLAIYRDNYEAEFEDESAFDLMGSMLVIGIIMVFFTLIIVLLACWLNKKQKCG